MRRGNLRKIFPVAQRRKCTLPRVYTCPHCEDYGERATTPQDVENARKISETDTLHRSRAFERVAPLDDEYRIYAEEAIEHYLPRPLYFLTTVINRLDSLNSNS